MTEEKREELLRKEEEEQPATALPQDAELVDSLPSNEETGSVDSDVIRGLTLLSVLSALHRSFFLWFRCQAKELKQDIERFRVSGSTDFVPEVWEAVDEMLDTIIEDPRTDPSGEFSRAAMHLQIAGLYPGDEANYLSVLERMAKLGFTSNAKIALSGALQDITRKMTAGED